MHSAVATRGFVSRPGAREPIAPREPWEDHWDRAFAFDPDAKEDWEVLEQRDLFDSDPTPEEIAAEAALIRAEWSPEEEEAHRVFHGEWQCPKIHVSTCTVSDSMDD